MNDKKLKAIVYSRVSSKEQLDGNSLKFQENDCKKFIEDRGFKYLETITDEGISGAKFRERKGLQSILEKAKNKEFDVIVFWKLDRLGRSLRDLVNIFETLEENNVKLVCATQPFIDTTSKSPFSSLIINLFGAFAEFEREVIRERVGSGKNYSLEKDGKWQTEAPFGYTKNEDKFLIVDKNTAPFVKEMFYKYGYEGMSLSQVGEYLDDRGVKTPRNKPGIKWKFSKSTLSGILGNPIYTGKVEVKRYLDDQNKTYTISVPPIISRGLWDRVQTRKKFNVHKNKGKSKYDFLYRDKIFCDKCKKKLYGQGKINSKGETILSYTYSRVKDTRGEYSKCCGWIRENVINRNLKPILIEFLKSPRDIIEKFEKNKESKVKSKLKVAENALGLLESRRLKLDKRFQMGFINEQEAKNELLEIDKNIAFRKQDIIELKSEILAEEEKQWLIENIITYASTKQGEIMEYDSKISSKKNRKNWKISATISNNSLDWNEIVNKIIDKIYVDTEKQQFKIILKIDNSKAIVSKFTSKGVPKQVSFSLVFWCFYY